MSLGGPTLTAEKLERLMSFCEDRVREMNDSAHRKLRGHEKKEIVMKRVAEQIDFDVDRSLLGLLVDKIVAFTKTPMMACCSKCLLRC